MEELCLAEISEDYLDQSDQIKTIDLSSVILSMWCIITIVTIIQLYSPLLMEKKIKKQ